MKKSTKIRLNIKPLLFIVIAVIAVIYMSPIFGENNTEDYIVENTEIILMNNDVNYNNNTILDTSKMITTLQDRSSLPLLSTTQYDHSIETEIEEVIEEIETIITHTVVANESYWSISKKYYGDGNYYKDIASYNNKNINDVLHIGEKLEIVISSDYEEVYEETPSISIEKTSYSNYVNTSVSTSGRYQPTVNINIPTGFSMKNDTSLVDTSNFTYIGSKRITGYTPGCVHCCGNDKGITASGYPAINGYTVAATGLPFGTTLYIEGYGYYVVEDRGGFDEGTIDIAAPSHESCYDLTASSVNVFIVS